jgi:CTP:molybdopterin cytidylyltransferase MocA
MKRPQRAAGTAADYDGRMVPAIVLAAGASSRMGRPKALLPVNGRPAVEPVCSALVGGGATAIVVVVGKHAAEIRAGADLSGMTVIDNANWSSGRTSSVQSGLAALPPTAEWTLLALVDMPLVRAATVRALLAAPRGGADVVVPVHDGRRGHPILLRRTLFAQIAALGPDEPLNTVVRAARRIDVAVDDPGVLIDFDEPGDVAAR